MLNRVLIAEDQEIANISLRKTLEELGMTPSDVYYCDDALRSGGRVGLAREHRRFGGWARLSGSLLTREVPTVRARPRSTRWWLALPWLAGCGVDLPGPEITSLEPNRGWNGEDTLVEIRGGNFFPQDSIELRRSHILVARNTFFDSLDNF